MEFTDWHTHDPDAPATALISVEPRDFKPRDGRFYSVGVHPWSTADDDLERQLLLLDSMLRHPRVVALGEVGLDRLRGATIESQLQILERQLAIAANVRQMPVVIHCVRAYDEIIAVHRRWSDRLHDRWIIHGFRRGPKLARRLIDEGFYISFGTRYNHLAFEITPPSRRLRETDFTPLYTNENLSL